MTTNDVFADAVAKLAAAGIDDPKGEARKLYGLAFPRRYGDEQDTEDGTALARFKGYVERRAKREPYSHISGVRHFWKYVFAVSPDVLDPRPDTETLVELALNHPFRRVLDLGTGSGCILVSLLAERDQARGVGTDISEKALEVARVNAAEVARLHQPDLMDRLQFVRSDWYKQIDERFDLIVSNPPYISAAEMSALEPEVRDHEPRLALTDENDGLDAYRVIAEGALDHLTEEGRLMVEIGPTQSTEVSNIFRKAGFDHIKVYPDLDGRDRVVSAQKTA